MKRRDFLLASATIACAPLARAAMRDSVGSAEADQAVRDGLRRGAQAALAKLGKENGFFANPQVKIGLSNNLRTANRILRTLGEGRKVDDLVLAMNRAAELAVPKAQPLLLEATREMNVQDARALLIGGDQALTGYFRKATEAELAAALTPAIQGVTESSGLTRAYDALSRTLVRLAGIQSKQATVEEYVNRKARDGLYAMIGVEERALRANPSQYAGEVVGRVFAVIK